MELDRRQLIGGALALLATGVASPAKGWLTQAGATPPDQATLHPAHQRTLRFPGDPGTGNLYYGAAVMASLSLPNLEKQLNGTLTVRRSYFSPGQTGGLIGRAEEDQAAGRLPLISTKVPGTWADVAAGKYDSWLMPILQGLDALSKPVMFGLHHEPEDEAGPPGMAPSDWVDMQTHAVSLAKSAAPNVGIVPILMQWTLDPRSGRDPQAWLVPSAPILGLDVYNDWSPGDGLPWLSFGQKASMAVQYAHGKPIAIAEYGCRTDPSQPGHAASWMTDAFAWCTNNNVAAMSYYDSNLHSRWGSWVLDAERIAAMKICLHKDNVSHI